MNLSWALATVPKKEVKRRVLSTARLERSYDVSSPRYHVATGTDREQDAIEALNSLQTPYTILEDRRKAGIRLDKNVNTQMKDCLARIGYSVS